MANCYGHFMLEELRSVMAAIRGKHSPGVPRKIRSSLWSRGSARAAIH